MEAFVYTLIASGIGATAFIAYKHHKQYHKLCGPFALFFLVIGLFAQTGAQGLEAGILRAMTLIPEDQHQAARDLIEKATDFPEKLSIGLFMYAAYVWALWWLPNLLELDKSED